jgi:hypothetical protein
MGTNRGIYLSKGAAHTWSMTSCNVGFGFLLDDDVPNILFMVLR